MAHHETYRAFKNTTEGKCERKDLGFSDGVISEDGSFMLGDLGSNADFVCSDEPARPSYWKGDWPKMSYSDVKTLMSIEASKKGATDGFIYTQTLKEHNA